MRHQRVGDTGTDQGKGQRGGSRERVSDILTDSRFVHRTGFLRTRTRTCSCQSWPRRHEADGGQEELDGRCVSLPSGLPGGGVTCSYKCSLEWLDRHARDQWLRAD